VKGVIAFVLLLAGCDLYFDDDGDGPSSVDGGTGGGSNLPADCARPYTATIFEPLDGADVPRAVTTRVRWNQPNIPDRYMSMSDHFGNYFQTMGIGETLGDGSIVDTFNLPAGGAFIFEIGWICDVENGGRTASLARIEFTTQP
jgi:hypothetical protein